MRIVNSLHADRPIIIDTIGTNNNFKRLSFATFKLCLKTKTQAHTLFWINENDWTSSAEFIKVVTQSQENPAAHWRGYLKHPLRKKKKESLGIDALVVDQATLHHMIFPALLTVCEDAIHREWIGSAVYHHKICDAPINTQDVQTFTIASFCSALHVTSRLCLHTLTIVSLGFVNKINRHMFCYLCYYISCLLYVKYAFKEVENME